METLLYWYYVEYWNTMEKNVYQATESICTTLGDLLAVITIINRGPFQYCALK